MYPKAKKDTVKRKTGNYCLMIRIVQIMVTCQVNKTPIFLKRGNMKYI